eukprot:Sspe_Gene.104671::Locus_81554_Transcript_1_1_Confidence_1.000_Length_793::g.104671::m.104671
MVLGMSESARLESIEGLLKEVLHRLSSIESKIGIAVPHRPEAPSTKPTSALTESYRKPYSETRNLSWRRKYSDDDPLASPLSSPAKISHTTGAPLTHPSGTSTLLPGQRVRIMGDRKLGREREEMVGRAGTVLEASGGNVKVRFNGGVEHWFSTAHVVPIPALRSPTKITDSPLESWKRSTYDDAEETRKTAPVSPLAGRHRSPTPPEE